jgi:isoquinoline 1-oxidoreductase subunit beta
MLIAAAAKKLNVDASALTTEPGYVVDAAGKQRIAYGELADAAAKLPIPTNLKLKDPSTFRIIGTPAKRLDVAGKVDGTAIYGIDVKLPGMKIATVAASPVFGGTLASFDDAAARKVPGAHQVVKLDSAVAVIADHYWAAKNGLEVGAATFNDGPHAALATADVVAALRPRDHGADQLHRAGDGGRLRYLGRHTDPHRRAEGRGANARTEAGAGASAQSPSGRRFRAAAGVRLHRAGGAHRQAIERPHQGRVEPRGGHPAQHVSAVYYDRFSAGLDEQGMPIAWSHRIVGSSIMARFFPPAFKDGIDPDAVDGAIDMPYAIANKRAASYSASRPRFGARSRSRTAASSSRTSTTTGCCASTRHRSSRWRWSRAVRTPAGSESPVRPHSHLPCSTRSTARRE